MTTAASLAQQTVRILTFVDDAPVPQNIPEKDDTLTALYNLHKLFPACAVITCPVQNGKFFYISDNCENIFGYDATYMANHFRRLPEYMSRLHETDMGDFLNCLQVLESFMKTQAPENYHQFRIVFHYRFCNAAGHYQYLVDEKAVLVKADGSKVYYCLVKRMPASEVFTGVKIEVFQQDGVSMEKLLEHQPGSTKKLSSRETDLVTLIKQGLTTKEIAWQLNISHHTVRNIKSRLFEKYSVNNTIELLNIAG